jgi:hypothetical protein
MLLELGYNPSIPDDPYPAVCAGCGKPLTPDEWHREKANSNQCDVFFGPLADRKEKDQ